MNIHTKATNITLTPEISDYLDKKISMLEKFLPEGDTSIKCSVELGKTTNHHKTGIDVFRTEINLSFAGKYMRAVSEDASLNASIDEAKDQMAAELTSYKSKRTTLVRRGGAVMKNILKGVGSGTGYVIGGIGSGFGGFKKIKNWRQKR